MSAPCEACLFRKQHKLSLSSIVHHIRKPFKIIYYDIWGPASVMSNFGFKYFVLFVDDFSRFTWIFFLKNKSDVAFVFYHFISFIER